MAVKPMPQKYATSDGREFDTEKDASIHEKLMEAQSKYKDARAEYSRLLWRTKKTADGVGFDLTKWDYWFIRSVFQFPSLDRVSFYGWNCELDDEDDDVVIYRQQTNEDTRIQRYKISELYYDSAAASAALLKVREEWLQDRKEEVEKLRLDVACHGAR